MYVVCLQGKTVDHQYIVDQSQHSLQTPCEGVVVGILIFQARGERELDLVAVKNI